MKTIFKRIPYMKLIIKKVSYTVPMTIPHIECDHDYKFVNTGLDAGVDRNGNLYEEHQKQFVCLKCQSEKLDCILKTTMVP